MTLEPLICPQCGAPVPLVHATSFPCPYCTATVAVPARYRTLFDANARAAGARREIEARYHNVVQAPPLSVDILAACLVLVLPAVVAVGYVWFGNPPSLEAVFTMAIIPALLPGAGVWVWSAAVHATIVRFELALACQPPDRDGGPGRCRKCGAPLEVETGAISARCAYCGTDSLLANVAPFARFAPASVMTRGVEVARLFPYASASVAASTCGSSSEGSWSMRNPSSIGRSAIIAIA